MESPLASVILISRKCVLILSSVCSKERWRRSLLCESGTHNQPSSHKKAFLSFAHAECPNVQKVPWIEWTSCRQWYHTGCVSAPQLAIRNKDVTWFVHTTSEHSTNTFNMYHVSRTNTTHLTLYVKYIFTAYLWQQAHFLFLYIALFIPQAHFTFYSTRYATRALYNTTLYTTSTFSLFLKQS